MADVVGLAASIIQIAGAGTKLSLALYNFTTSAVRADQDVKDIADDVELTSNALESVGRVFEMEDAKSIISKKAIQDANNIIKKCESVFNEISEIIEKRRKPGKDGKKSLSLMGKLSFPMKEQRIELNRRRLESLKNSLVLLLHVLQLAQGQARGQMERSVMEEEREKIRELHQRQQDSLKSLQALESRFCKVTLDDEETLQGSATASRVPTLDFMANAHPSSMPPLEKTDSQATLKTLTIDLSTVDDSETSESDATITDDEDEHLSLEELSQCARQVQKLLKRITMLQHNFESSQKTVKHRKKRVHTMYRRFCRKFESNIDIAPTPPATQSGLLAGSNRGENPHNFKPIILEASYRRESTHGNRSNNIEDDFRQPHATRAVSNDIHRAEVSDDQLPHLRPPPSLEFNDWSETFPSLIPAVEAVPDAKAMLPPERNLDFAPPSQQSSLKAPDIELSIDALTPPRPSHFQPRRRKISGRDQRQSRSSKLKTIKVHPSKTEHLPPPNPWDTASLDNFDLARNDSLEAFDFDGFLHNNQHQPFEFKNTLSQPPTPLPNETSRLLPVKKESRPTQGDRVYLRETNPTQPETTQGSGEVQLNESSVSNEKKIGKLPTAPTITGPPIRFIDLQFSMDSPYSPPMLSLENNNDHTLRRIHSSGTENLGRSQKFQPNKVQQQQMQQRQQMQQQQQQMLQPQQMQQSTPASQRATPVMTPIGAQQQSLSVANIQSLTVIAVQQMRRHIEQQGIPAGRNAQAYQQHLTKVFFAKLKMEADRSQLQADSATVAQSLLPLTQVPQADLLPYPKPQSQSEAHSPYGVVYPFSFSGSASMIPSHNSFTNTGSSFQIPAQPHFPHGPAPPGNHALQDYHMQLMLLEQQNKKRLLMARQEQVAGASDDPRAISPAGNSIIQSLVPLEQMKRSATPQVGLSHDIDDKKQDETHPVIKSTVNDPKQYSRDFTDGSDILFKPDEALHNHVSSDLGPSGSLHSNYDGSNIPINTSQPRQENAFHFASSTSRVPSETSSAELRGLRQRRSARDCFVEGSNHTRTSNSPSKPDPIPVPVDSNTAFDSWTDPFLQRSESPSSNTSVHTVSSLASTVSKGYSRELMREKLKDLFGEDVMGEDKDTMPQIGESVDEKSKKAKDKMPATRHPTLMHLPAFPRRTIPSKFETTPMNTPSDLPPDTTFTNLTSPDIFYPATNIASLEPVAGRKRSRESDEKGEDRDSIPSTRIKRKQIYMTPSLLTPLTVESEEEIENIPLKQEWRPEKPRRKKSGSWEEQTDWPRDMSYASSPPPVTSVGNAKPSRIYDTTPSTRRRSLSQDREEKRKKRSRESDEEGENSGRHSQRFDVQSVSEVAAPAQKEDQEQKDRRSKKRIQRERLAPLPRHPYSAFVPTFAIESLGNAMGEATMRDGEGVSGRYGATSADAKGTSEPVAPTNVEGRKKKEEAEKVEVEVVKQMVEKNKKLKKKRPSMFYHPSSPPPPSTPFVLASAPQDLMSISMGKKRRFSSNVLYKRRLSSASERAETENRETQMQTLMGTETQAQEKERDIVDILLEQWTVPVY